MTDKELRALGKVDLLKLLRDQELELDTLRQQNKSLERQLEDRRLALASAGSIADAALQVTGIFKVAQESADLYIENVRQLEARSRAEAETAEARALEKADQILSEVERKCAQREAREKAYVDELWAELQDKLTQFCRSYTELGELVGKVNILPPIQRPRAAATEDYYEPQGTPQL